MKRLPIMLTGLACLMLAPAALADHERNYYGRSQGYRNYAPTRLGAFSRNTYYSRQPSPYGVGPAVCPLTGRPIYQSQAYRVPSGYNRGGYGRSYNRRSYDRRSYGAPARNQVYFRGRNAGLYFSW